MAEKKKFIDVKLPILATTVQLFAAKQEDLIGRVVKLDLTKFLKGKGAEAKFLIVKQEDKIFGDIFSFEMYPSYIKRLIGHNTSIVEDSFIVKTQDSCLRIKPFLITRKKVYRSVRNALRKGAREFIEKISQDKTKEKIFQATMSGILQKQLSRKLKKIYPLAVCELRVVKVEKTK
ncbi:MAG: 40S ribosomal protein S3a/S1 [Candidatus Pacearchaeota archaeon]|nr:40S ribosomal protein S3a/S1 [Candidatus Pacearchaeota archaeon]